MVPASSEEHGRLVESHKAVSVHGFRELKVETSSKTVTGQHRTLLKSSFLDLGDIRPKDQLGCILGNILTCRVGVADAYDFFGGVPVGIACPG